MENDPFAQTKGTQVKVIEVPGWRPDAHHRLGDQGTLLGGSGNPFAPFLVQFPDGEEHAYTNFEIDFVNEQDRLNAQQAFMRSQQSSRAQ